MHKKFMSLFLALGMVANIGVAYAADLVPPGADGAPEVLEGPQGGTGGNVGAQGTQEAQGGSRGFLGRGRYGEPRERPGVLSCG